MESDLYTAETTWNWTIRPHIASHPAPVGRAKSGDHPKKSAVFQKGIPTLTLGRLGQDGLFIHRMLTGWWFGTCFIFPRVVGISSSQLTFIFSEGWLNHQPVLSYISMLCTQLPPRSFKHHESRVPWLVVTVSPCVARGYGYMTNSIWYSYFHTTQLRKKSKQW